FPLHDALPICSAPESDPPVACSSLWPLRGSGIKLIQFALQIVHNMWRQVAYQLFYALCTKVAIKFKQVGVITHHGDVKSGVIHTQAACHSFDQSNRRWGNVTMDNTTAPGDVVMETIVRLDSPITANNLFTNHDQTEVAVDGQIFLCIQDVSLIAVGVPVGTVFNKEDTLPHAGLGNFCHEWQGHCRPDSFGFIGRVAMHQGKGYMLGNQCFEDAGHLYLVVADQVAGQAGKDTSLKAEHKGINLPVLRKKNPIRCLDIVFVTEKKFGFDVGVRGEFQGSQSIETDQLHIRPARRTSLNERQESRHYRETVLAVQWALRIVFTTRGRGQNYLSRNGYCESPAISPWLQEPESWMPVNFGEPFAGFACCSRYRLAAGDMISATIIGRGTHDYPHYQSVSPVSGLRPANHGNFLLKMHHESSCY